MSSPDITIIIDTYNYGRFIEEAIESVLSQDFPANRMQILVVDDGSTDDTAERVKKYDSRSHYLYKPNGGQASAFNWGLARALGELIFFLDADDYWLPGKLGLVVNAFRDPSVGMVCHNYLISRFDSPESSPCALDLVSGFVPGDFASLLRYRVFPTSCLAFRREALNRLLPVPEAIGLQADAYLALLIIFVARVAAVAENLAVYRVHGENRYSTGAAQRAPEESRYRSRMWKIILEEMRLWLMRNGFDVSRREIRAFLDQWLIFQENQEFAVDPPTRFRLFSHLLRYNRTYRSQQSWKLTILNYFSAVAALAVGFKQPDQQSASSKEARRA
jgi:glycosyltransferase involved in cell wall biosynthesis